jgi:hypothetical protein
MPENQAKSGSRTLIIYLLVLAFVCICSAVAISQRLDIARAGRDISKLGIEAEKLRFQQSYLKLRVAEKASYKNLVAKAQELKLDVVPPEEKRSASEDEGE